MNKIVTILIFSLMLSVSPYTIFAQEPVNNEDSLSSKPIKPKKNIADKIYYGGTISLSFSNNYTMIGAYPLIGYKLTPKLSLGVKGAYEYIIDKRYASTYNANNFGLSVFSRYRIIPPIYFHVEYAQMNYDLYYGMADRVWVPFLFVGGGYSQRIGSRSWFNIQVLFDVLQDDSSPYSDWTPFISVGVGVGF